MRFMVLMIPGVYQGGKKIDPNFAPDVKKMEQMGRFNEELKKDLKLIALDGLQPITKGARLSYSKSGVKVTDGPFVESKEVLGGYWMIEAKSKEEVVNWMKRCPADDGDVIEIRQVFEMSDFPIQEEALR